MVTVGISTCLLGEKVRYDGNGARDRYVTDVLLKHLHFAPFCPEVEVMGVPRESIRLVDDLGKVVVLGNQTKSDYTQLINDSNQKLLEKVQKSDIDGYIFKAKSPTCAIDNTKLYFKNDMPAVKRSGLFFEKIEEKFAFLPVIDEGRLNDMWLRENFLIQLFGMHRLKTFLRSKPTMYALVQFHTVNKFLLLSRHQENYYSLGRVVANSEKEPFEELLARYATLYRETLMCPSNVRKESNVLSHIYGFIKNRVTEIEKREILAILDQFKEKKVPLITPLAVLKIYFAKYDVSYMLDQSYLEPYPAELSLRGHMDALKE